MAALTDYCENKILDAWRSGNASPVVFPATSYWAVISVTGIGGSTSTAGWIASTVVTLNQTISVNVSGTQRIFKATVAGTTAGTVPTWPTTAGGTVVDNTVTWTEQTLAIEAGTFVEFSGGTYARVSQAKGLSVWAGSQGAGTTVASTGTNATTSNNSAITFPTSSTVLGWAAGLMEMDAASGGNPWTYELMATPVYVPNSAALTFNAASVTLAFDNA